MNTNTLQPDHLESSLTVSRNELLTDGTDSTFRDMVHALLAFSVRLEGVRQEFGAQIGLSGIQYTILISVAHLQGEVGIGVKAIAKHLSLSGAFVTIEVGKLKKHGLISKRTNPNDRRRVLLNTTDEATARLNSLAGIQQQVNDVLFEPLSSSQFAAIVPLAHELVESSDNALLLAQYLTGSKENLS